MADPLNPTPMPAGTEDLESRIGTGGAGAALSSQQPDAGQQPYVQDQSGATLAMGGSGTPEVGQPPVTGTKDGIKSLLTGIFGQHGIGGELMNRFGIPTPDQRQQQQQNQAILQQGHQALTQMHQATARSIDLGNSEITIPQAPLADGTPQAPIVLPQRYATPALVQTLKNASKADVPMTTIGPEHVKINPQLQPLLGQQYPTMLLDKSILGTAAAQNKTATAPAKPASAAARDDRYIALQGVNPATWTDQDRQFVKGYNKYVDVNKVQPGLQRAQIFAAPRWASLDPDLQARQALAKGMATGALGNQLTSFNAFVGHLGDFHDAVQTLKNSDLKLYNTAINEISQQTGDPKIQGVIAKIEPVRKEFESLLLNNRALYEADRKSADVILNPASSPAQLEIAVKSLAGTAAIRLGSVNQGVKRITGSDIPEILEPSNGAILEELGASIPGYEGSGQNFETQFKNPLSPNTRPTGGGTGKKIRVRNKATGQVGTLSEKYFDSSKYERQ